MKNSSATFPRITHEMLVANAGSGKTFRLTIRTITLLAMGVSPEKIAALTFTRKAAGEFLEAVFVRLAKSASDPAALTALQRDTGIQSLNIAQCRSILVNLTSHLHRLCMGTIDSLFGRIARAFPLESGLSENFSILSATSGNESRLQVLATLFRENAADENRFAEFLDVVRQQNRMASERQVFRTLLETVSQLQGKFLQTPGTHTWGEKEIIWPDGCAILEAGDHSSAAVALWLAITSTHPDLDAKATAAWEGNLQAVRDHISGQNWGDPLKKFVKDKLCDCKEDPETSQQYLATGGAKKARVYLNDLVAPARHQLLFSLLKPKFEELIRRSRSLHVMMEAFEKIYARSVRNQGRVTFEDITNAIAGQVDDPSWRAEVGYRLDARFDHWLIDEFQDTSRPQWKVLGALVDEIIQDQGGERSFFYVGDTKQAIYSWRGGDPKLFFDIREYYNQGAEAPIVATPALNISFRSDPEIIAVVNQVFGNIGSAAEALELPAKTVSDWTRAWVSHEVTEKNKSNQGYVRWTPVDAKSEDEENDSASAVDCEILRILEDVRPWERGWSCAALKRNNRDVEALAAVLQSHGIPLAMEGSSNPCTDNPLGAAFLAAFRYTASPDDQLSGALLASSQIGKILLKPGDFIFRERTLRLICEEGFGGVTQAWISELDLSGEPFLDARAGEFLAAAEQFDQERQSSEGIGEFVRFLESYQRQEPEGSGVVRIMTVHQAKGLTLDMAVVSGLDADPFAKDRTAGTLALDRNRHKMPWGLLLPSADLSKQDEVLSAARTAILSESTYGELCAAYVAMTRPRHGLYILTKKLSEKTSSKNFARLLGETLGQLEPWWERGNANWYQTKPVKISPEIPGANIQLALPKPIHTAAHAISPSHLHESTENWGALRSSAPASSSSEAATIGTEIHEVLAGIEWIDTSFPELPTTLSESARELLEAFLASDTATKLFHCPTQPGILWRERAFDILLEGQWVTGVFDRVHISLDASGQPLSALVYDFKTDSATPDELITRYHGQIAIYKKAAGLLLGLDAQEIGARLISVRHP